MPVRESRFRPLAGALLPLTAVVLVYCLGGCNSPTPPPTPPSGETENSTQTGAADTRIVVPPRFQKWETPTAALLLSGEQHGRIEPCGCSELLSGGLSRRADLVRQLREQGWNVAGLDIGGTVERNRFQSRLKFGLTLDVFEALGYEAIALGPEELKFGVDELINTHQNRLPSYAEQNPSFVAANVTIFGSADLSPRRSEVFKVGEATIGVSAILSPSYAKGIPDTEDPLKLSIGPPAEALQPVVQSLGEQKTDFNVLLAHAPLEEAKALAEQFPQFRIVLAAEGSEEPVGKPISVGDRWVLQIGRKGKYAGVLAYYADDSQEPFRFELIDLDMERFRNSPLVEKHLRAYQDAIAANMEPVFADLFPSAHPSGAQFVGAQTCGECHTKAYEKWKTSKHSHAYESVVTGREGQFATPISRRFDTECLSCHVTGWDPEKLFRYSSGFLPEKLATAHGQPELYTALQGNQCENCHGPGSEHVQLERNWKSDRASVNEEQLKFWRRTLTQKKEEARNHLCVECHDGENSPKFDFDKYWEEIKHPWRD